MIVLDSYAVIALVLGESAAPEVADLLNDGRPSVMTALGPAEVADRLVRLRGIDPDEVALDLAELGLLEPEPLDGTVALQAGLLRARWYHRSRCAVSLADCLVAAVARRHGAAVATSDPHLLDMCSGEGLEMVVLPSSTGERWSSRSREG